MLVISLALHNEYYLNLGCSVGAENVIEGSKETVPEFRNDSHIFWVDK